MKNNINEALTNAVRTGLNVFSDPELRIKSTDVENISTLKQLFRSLLQGELLIASPDQLKSAAAILEKAEDNEIGDN